MSQSLAYVVCFNLVLEQANMSPRHVPTCMWPSLQCPLHTCVFTHRMQILIFDLVENWRAAFTTAPLNVHTFYNF